MSVASLQEPAPAGPAPRVSMGLPIFNGERFLREALDSLLAQTHTDFELLISDNASTDSTPQICLEYAARDGRVSYLRQASNIGAPRNWNFVARRARGEYFKWATANDECEPPMLQRCVEALDAAPEAVLAQGVTCLVDEASGERQPYSHDLALPEPRPAERLLALFTRLRLNNGQSGLIRTSALRRTGYDRFYEGGDFVLMAELALQGRFLVLPEVLLCRRMGPTTFSGLLTADAMHQFFDPQHGRRFISGRSRLHLDMMRSVATAPLPWRHKLEAMRVALRGMAWERTKLFAARQRHSEAR